MIQVVNRAIDILEFLAKTPDESHGLSTIANSFKLNHATCANIIKTLVARGYVEQEGKKKGYKLGPMSYYLTGNYSYRDELIDAADEPMALLSQEINEGSILAILRDDIRVIIHEKEAHHELRVVNYKEKHAYSTSTGRLIIAYLKDNQLEDYIHKHGMPSAEVWPEADSKEKFKQALKRIREQKYAIQESRAHIIGIAVPIWRKGNAIASLGVYLPQSRMNENNRDFIFRSLKDTAKTINHKIEMFLSARKEQEIEVSA